MHECQEQYILYSSANTFVLFELIVVSALRQMQDFDQYGWKPPVQCLIQIAIVQEFSTNLPQC